MEQRRELRMLLESGTLYRHAGAVLADAYDEAQKQAAAETMMPRATFPAECPWNLETLLADEDEDVAGKSRP